MQKLLLFTALLFSSLSLSAQDIHFLLANKVNVRSSASTSGSIVANLPIGTEVEVLEETGNLKLKGLEMPWAKISFQDEGRNKLGYVWTGFLARDRYELTDNTYLVWGVEKLSEGEYMNDVSFQFRVYRNGQELSKTSVNSIGDVHIYREVRVFGDRGVKGVRNIIEHEFSAEYCGGAMGTVVFFWDGKTLHHARTLHDGADAPMWYSEEFVYPEDSAGLGDKILWISETGGEEDESGEEFIETDQSLFRWTGSKLVQLD